ncbi:MAG TPA: hypothetical protein VJ719_07260 [Chthoniobacterales bacterium]|nr:hypothetical protein [Chthoniobacterales bacterium]
MAYGQLLVAHNLIRWLVLIAAIVALVSAFSGWSGSKPMTAAVRRCGAVFVATLDLQFLIGLVLYLVASPITKAAFQNMAAAMKDHEPRFFTVEHTTYMLIAIIAAHVGSALSRKGKTDARKYRGAVIGYGISLIVILAGIPWWRPMFRWVS